MPIYEYQCSSCGHKKEALQKLSDAPLKDCPACGKPSLTKLISAAGFQLKGSGWYVTDFKGGKSGKSDSEKSGSQAASDSKIGDGDKSGGSDKSGGDKAGGEKSGESKSTETKSADSKGSESAKPAAASSGTNTAAATKAS
ncbi:MAG: zinc ribbon domain-containing protein [Betaproteobacteria bacterium]